MPEFAVQVVMAEADEAPSLVLWRGRSHATKDAAEAEEVTLAHLLRQFGHSGDACNTISEAREDGSMLFLGTYERHDDGRWLWIG